MPLPAPARLRAQLLSRANRFYASHRLDVPSSYGQPDGQHRAEEDDEDEGNQPGQAGPNGSGPDG